MYYPVLRGKQNELLALRECAEHLKSSSILPVVEPVRDLANNGGSLRRCLTQLQTSECPVAVVVNPSVGEYAAQTEATEHIMQLIEDIDPDARNIRLAVVLGAPGGVAELTGSLTECTRRPHIYLHESASSVGEQDLHALTATATDATHLADERSRVRRHPAFTGADARVAKLSDPFQRAASNAAYADCMPYLFTDWNVYYQDDGYVGYADFATIGREYSTSGFTPRAVAIHLTYKNEADGSIWIQHFVSQSDRDTMANVAAKFSEALSKLIQFVDDQDLTNPAIEQFRHLDRLGQFPGLGVVKRLSILNHLYVGGSAGA